MMTCLGGGGIVPFLTLALGGEWSASCSDHFTPGQGGPLIHWRGGWWLGGPQSWSGCGGEEKNSQLPPGRNNCDYNERVHLVFVNFKGAYDFVRRTVPYNILSRFGISKQLVELIKKHSN
jgi:hypothetical protein